MSRINITFEDGNVLEVEKGTTVYEISKIYEKDRKYPIVGAEIDNELISMDTQLTKNTKLKFIDITSTNGYKINKRGLEFICEVALKEQFNNEFEMIVNHSIENGIHFSVKGERNFTVKDAEKLKVKMNEIISKDERIYEINVDQEQAIDYFKKVHAEEKSKNIHNLTNNIVTLYKLGNYINYFYSTMPYSTGRASHYDIIYLGNNDLVLMFPTPRTRSKNPEYVHYQGVIKCYRDTECWLNAIKIPYLSDLNDLVSQNKIKDIIKLSETKFDNDIYDTVNDIIKNKARYVLLAGPSSSGKTTTSKKIALQLRSRGYEVLTLSTDDYFKERIDSPKDAEGHYDFECLECLDLKLLNKQLKDLLSGKKVSLPTFNFVTGEKEYNDEPIKIGENTIIIMEGLHCLNDAMTPDIDPKFKYKVYLSPFLAMNIDRHNYVSSNDLRLLRRIVRDNRDRAYDVGVTITHWNKVKMGAEKHIYPYINNANRVLNTSIIYELGVLKVFVEPLLYSVKATSPAYAEARRLINSLKTYLPIPSEYAPYDSIIREFIGGSEFENYK